MRLREGALHGCAGTWGAIALLRGSRPREPGAVEMPMRVMRNERSTRRASSTRPARGKETVWLEWPGTPFYYSIRVTS